MRRRGCSAENERGHHGASDPLYRHLSRSRLRVLSEKGPQARLAASPDRLRGRRHGGSFHLESDRPGYRAVERYGTAGLPSGFSRLLGRYPVPAAARSRHPAPAQEHRPDRGSEKPSDQNSHDGPCRDPAQHTRGDGGGRRLCRAFKRFGKHHSGRCAGSGVGHRHSELPGGCDHLHAALRRGQEQAEVLLARRSLRGMRSGSRFCSCIFWLSVCQTASAASCPDWRLPSPTAC